MKLLSRDQFKTQVFKRDLGQCVFCSLPAVDAHHLIERKLWEDGGYYLENGASVCEIHHLECEHTLISVETIRNQCNIQTIGLPPYFDARYTYDKWGNPVLSNGKRLRGELFFEDSVQKILTTYQLLPLFESQTLPPRIFNIPLKQFNWQNLYRIAPAFTVEEIIVFELPKTEYCTLYSDVPSPYTYPDIQKNLPESWRIEGFVDSKQFHGLRIWNNLNVCLSWNETLEWFELLNIFPIKPIYQGKFAGLVLQNLPIQSNYTLRTVLSITYKEARYSMANFALPA